MLTRDRAVQDPGQPIVMPECDFIFVSASEEKLHKAESFHQKIQLHKYFKHRNIIFGGN